MPGSSMNKPLRVVIVEDDREIGALVAGLLSREGFITEWLRSGEDLDHALAREATDLLLLDLMLPGEDGLTLCRRVRAKSQLPIIMVTAKGDDLDRILGLEMGADDYLPKPFNPRELLARVRAVLRRTAPVAQGSVAGQGHECLCFAGFRFDLLARRLLGPDGREIELSAGDYDLLAVFTRYPNRVLSRDRLMDLTKGRSWEVFDRSIDVAASRLRRKIEPEPGHPQLIKTVRNGGYLFAVEVERAT